MSKVDEIVQNNTDENNTKIVVELELVKSTIEFIVEQKKGTGLSEVAFEDEMRRQFPLFAERYITIFHKIVRGNDDINMVYAMIDSQIEVAKRRVSYRQVADDFGHMLHDRYVKPVIEQ